MSWIARLYYDCSAGSKAVRLYLVLAGPGVVVMIADNDAGGITTYAATGAKYQYSLIWFLVILGPVAYYIQEMTVRLGAVTKRATPKRSSMDLALSGLVLAARPAARRLAALVTEFIGMTSALAIFGVPRG